MSSATGLLYSDIRASLLREVGNVAGRGNLEEAFSAWLLRDNAPLLDLTGPARAAAAKSGAQRGYQDVAVLGFAAAAGVLERGQEKTLIAGLKWIAGRSPFVEGSPAGFCFDVLALLGIALAAKHAEDGGIKKAVADWMSQFIAECYKMPRMEDWQRCLLAAAQKEVDASPDLALPMGESVADVRVALRARGLLPVDMQDQNRREEENTLKLLKEEKIEEIGAVRAALQVVAYDWVRREIPTYIPGRVTINDVVNLLRRVPAGLRLWTWEAKPRTSGTGAMARKWCIDNEYHVQNLLWFLLAPVFPDLKQEEYTPSVGQIRPRADLAIPSLNLIIEVKFVRQSKSFQEIIEEIASDASLYRTKSSIYTSIVAFVWDDSRRTEQHDTLVHGLKQINGVVDAIVVPRPGSMSEPAAG